MRIKFVFILLILLFSVKNSCFPLGFITDLSKSISEKNIIKEIHQNKFDLALQNLNSYIKKYDENVNSYYLRYLIFSDIDNKNYSLENSYINSYKALEKYISLNNKEKEKIIQKMYLNEFVLESSTKMLQNNLIRKYGNNLDSINILLNILQKAKIDNQDLVEKVKSKENNRMFNEAIKSNRIEDFEKFIVETKDVELKKIANNKIELLKSDKNIESNDNKTYTTRNSNSVINNNNPDKVINNISKSENEKYNENTNTNPITYSPESILTDDKSGCKLNTNMKNFQINWKGACIDGYVDGKGECKFFKNNTLSFTYIGNFSKGTVIYPLTISYPDGSKYFGDLIDGKYSRGVFTLVDGSTYSGNWIDGKLNGQGTSTSTNGSVFVGDWKDNKKNGKGTLTMADGSKYVGEWKDNILSGSITYYFADGSVFNGVMENEEIIGYGTCTYPNGSVYTGNWKNGEIYGKVKLTKKNGESYSGDWENGKENGHGTFSYVDGSNYEGEWRNGKRNGFGTYTFSDGTKYIGEWSNNEINGKGTMIYIIGDNYVGEWKNGIKCGQGIYNFGDGSKYVGTWNSGKMIVGKVYTSSGEIAYDGNMANYYK